MAVIKTILIKKGKSLIVNPDFKWISHDEAGHILGIYSEMTAALACQLKKKSLQKAHFQHSFALLLVTEFQPKNVTKHSSICP